MNNTAPSYDLEVGGSIGVDTEIVHAGDNNTKFQFTINQFKCLQVQILVLGLTFKVVQAN